MGRSAEWARVEGARAWRGAGGGEEGAAAHLAHALAHLPCRVRLAGRHRVLAEHLAPGRRGGVGTGSWVGVGEIEIVARSSRDRGSERRCDGRGGVCEGVARQADGGQGGEAVGTDSMSSGLTPVSSHTPASSAAWVGAGVGAG